MYYAQESTLILSMRRVALHMSGRSLAAIRRHALHGGLFAGIASQWHQVWHIPAILASASFPSTPRLPSNLITAASWPIPISASVCVCGSVSELTEQHLEIRQKNVYRRVL